MRFHVLAMRYYGGEYGDQKTYLEKVNEKNGIDVFVASYGGREVVDVEVEEVEDVDVDDVLVVGEKSQPMSLIRSRARDGSCRALV